STNEDLEIFLDPDMHGVHLYLWTTYINAEGLDGALLKPEEASASCTLAPVKR
ncbi:hypothetical protein HAX54_022776, partial [Datura stramonium]|nr:hypothetical protein [Datura stramonium]